MTQRREHRRTRPERHVAPHFGITYEEEVAVAEMCQRFDTLTKKLHRVEDFHLMNQSLGFNMAKMVRPLLAKITDLDADLTRLQALNRRLTIENQAMTSAIQRHRDQADGMASRIKELEILYDETTGEA